MITIKKSYLYYILHLLWAQKLQINAYIYIYSIYDYIALTDHTPDRYIQYHTCIQVDA